MNIGRIVLTGAAALTLAAGGTVAGAAIASGPVSAGVVHACYVTRATSAGGHAIVLQNAGTRCPRGTTALTWNQRGPAGPPGSSAVYGRIIGLDFGTISLYLGAPSGVSTGSLIDRQGEELSATSAHVLHNLQVQLVQPGSDTADPVPSPPGNAVTLVFADQAGNLTGCTVFAGASTCSLPTIGTIPAGSILTIFLSVDPTLLPGYAPDVVFNYQATAAS